MNLTLFSCSVSIKSNIFSSSESPSWGLQFAKWKWGHRLHGSPIGVNWYRVSAVWARQMSGSWWLPQGRDYKMGTLRRAWPKRCVDFRKKCDGPPCACVRSPGDLRCHGAAKNVGLVIPALEEQGGFHRRPFWLPLLGDCYLLVYSNNNTWVPIIKKNHNVFK